MNIREEKKLGNRGKVTGARNSFVEELSALKKEKVGRMAGGKESLIFDGKNRNVGNVILTLTGFWGLHIVN